MKRLARISRVRANAPATPRSGVLEAPAKIPTQPRPTPREIRKVSRVATRAEKDLSRALVAELRADERAKANPSPRTTKALTRAQTALAKAEARQLATAAAAERFAREHDLALEPNGEFFPQVEDLNPKPSEETERRRRAFYRAIVPILRAVVRLTYGARVVHDGPSAVPAGSVVVVNHVSYLDSVMAAVALWPHRLHFLALASNGYGHVWGPIVRALGTIFVGHTLAETREMTARLGEALAAGDCVAIFPEGDLVPYNPELQPFKRGAFQIAAAEHAPVVPVTLVQAPGEGVVKSLFAKPGFVVHVGEPIRAPEGMGTHKAALYLAERTRRAMQAALEVDPLFDLTYADALAADAAAL